jgi:hypothetical protein
MITEVSAWFVIYKGKITLVGAVLTSSLLQAYKGKATLLFTLYAVGASVTLTYGIIEPVVDYLGLGEDVKLALATITSLISIPIITLISKHLPTAITKKLLQKYGLEVNNKGDVTIIRSVHEHNTKKD